MSNRRKCAMRISLSVLVLWMCCSLAAAKVVYVCEGVPAGGDGTSWTNAYTLLQDALHAPHLDSGDEIWVAQGTYTPDQGGGNIPGNRAASFQLINGITIKGGYAGLSAPDPDLRNIEMYNSILSGDLNGNDVGNLDDPSRNENVYHVVTADGTDRTAVLDGFVIEGGNANGGGKLNLGGGFYKQGGGVTLKNCTFIKNSAKEVGGGMRLDDGEAVLLNCCFEGNSAKSGGGMGNQSSSGELINCKFIQNLATVVGGGLLNGHSNMTLINCEIAGNVAGQRGGAMRNAVTSYPIMINCTVSGNSSAAIGGIDNHSSQVTVTSCILWANNDNSGVTEYAQIGYYPSWASPIISYSCVQGWTGGLGGTGNIGDDPLFFDPANEDFYKRNYHLLLGSPCIDAGDPNYQYVPDEMDLDGNPRVIEGRVDMGAYESNHLELPMKFTPQALNLVSRGNWVKAHFVLPRGFEVADVDVDTPAVIKTMGIDSDYIIASMNQNYLVEVEIFFDRAEFCASVVSDDLTEVTVIGLLTTGQQFYGRDTLKIIHK